MKNLNSKYNKYSENCTDVSDCLKQIAEVTPYRYLSTFSHKLAAVEHDNQDNLKKKKFWKQAQSSKKSSIQDQVDSSSSSAGSPPRKKVLPASFPTKQPKKKSTSSSLPADGEGEGEDWEMEFKEFPQHLKYFKKLRLAQAKANDTGKRVQICWRGNRSSVIPRMGDMKKYEYIQRLIQALKNVRFYKPNEKKVIC